LPYRIKHPRRLADEISRIATEQAERAIREIDDASLDRHATVHQVRKRCKKLRGVLRLLRGPLDEDGTFSRENARFRDAARDLSKLRDAETLIGTYDALMEHFADEVNRKAFANVRRQLTLRRNEIAGNAQDPDAQLAVVRQTTMDGLERIPEWAERAEDFDSLAPGLRKTYRRGRKAMKSAYRDEAAEAFHEWRKRTKYHWYHCRILQILWQPVMQARSDEISRLADILGDEHDLSVFRETMTAMEPVDGETLSALMALIDRRRDELRNVARPLGKRVFAEKTKHLTRSFRSNWKLCCG
jgi:CHAD domain-containing protein